MEFVLRRKTDVALRALLALAEYGTRMRAKDIAEKIGTTAPYVPHIMAPLMRAGWVDSSRGPTGGYRLRVPTTEISVLAVIEAEEGPMDSEKCVLRGGPCGARESCAIHIPWTSARRALLDELASATIASSTE